MKFPGRIKRCFDPFGSDRPLTRLLALLAAVLTLASLAAVKHSRPRIVYVDVSALVGEHMHEMAYEASFENLRPAEIQRLAADRAADFQNGLSRAAAVHNIVIDPNADRTKDWTPIIRGLLASGPAVRYGEAR